MSSDKPEKIIQREIVEFLRFREWHVERMLANAFQTGIPDLYAFHRKWGSRWIEVKKANDYTFTRAQRQKWPEWEKAGIPIFILTAATEEQYALLFKAPNWRDFWKPSFVIPDAKGLFDALAQEYEQSKATDPMA